MTFNPTLECTNEMIQFGSQLDHQDYSEYQSKMIQKFYPDADIDTINQMTEWAKYPTLNLITLDALKHIEITLTDKAFKASMINQIVGQHHLDGFNQSIACIRQSNGFGLSPQMYLQVAQIYSLSNGRVLHIQWNQMVVITHNGHSGFTGTFAWADPVYKINYVFLSNRVCPSAENWKIRDMNVRTNIQQVIYEAVMKRTKK